MELRNFMEDMVLQHLDVLLRSRDSCKCDRCRYDIAALALNNLPSKYYVTRRGEVFTKLHTWQQQVHADVTTALVHAIAQVNRQPHHD